MKSVPLCSPVANGPTLRGPAFLALILSVACLAACSKKSGAEAATGAPAAKEVGVATVQAERLTLTTELPGRTTARMIAEIRPQVGGIVQKRLFEEGAMVKAGQVLYQIDPATFQAAVNSAQAALRKAEAAVAVARSTAARNAELVKIDAISRQVEEASQAALQQADADVGSARAALENARINLGFTRITAPISGRANISTVTSGALVTANQADALTTVQQLDPIYVDLTQSSAELLRLRKEVDSGRMQAGAAPGEARIRVLLEDGSTYAHEGRLQFSGVTVDPSTGSVTLRAVVPNPDGLLMPGMYVRAAIAQGVNEKALLVPQQAVTRNPNGSAWLLAVGADNKVARRNLTLDRAVGSRWLVTEGVQAGDRVIVEGLQRVRAGDLAKPVAVSPAASDAAAEQARPASGAASTAAAG